MQYTHSELHTHLIGMLSFKGLINLLYDMKYPGFPVDVMGNLDFSSYRYGPRSKEITKKLHDQLSVSQNDSVPYEDLDMLYANRNSLLADLAACISKSPPRTPKYNKALKQVFSMYLNYALIELIEQGVEYVEISYANIGRIKYMMENIHPEIKSRIKVKFLLCTNRGRAVLDLDKDVETIRSTIKSDAAVGFDFMGLEIPFNDNENDPDDEPSNSLNSFKKKMDLVIDVLKDFPNSVLRVHAGENSASINNPLNTLRKIDEVAREKGIEIPPPEIRLGHAIYFHPTTEYLLLLKKYKCIIEINASSNMALSNISSPSEINYNFYLDNGIRVVLSTDGGGIYDTTLKQEDSIARWVAGEESYKKILKIDNAIISKKGKK